MEFIKIRALNKEFIFYFLELLNAGSLLVNQFFGYVEEKFKLMAFVRHVIVWLSRFMPRHFGFIIERTWS
jgi:hypothetical protein